MGFRNPLSSLSGDQITPGVITGSTIQTAAAGKRVALHAAGGSGDPGSAAFYTGHPGEHLHGRIAADVELSPISPRGVLEIASPVIAGGGSQLRPAAVVLRSSSGDGFTVPAIMLDADTIELGYAGRAEVHAGSLAADNMPDTRLWGVAGVVRRPQLLFIDQVLNTDDGGVCGPFNVAPSFSAVHGVLLTGVAIGTGIVAEVVDSTPTGVKFRVWRTDGTLATSVPFGAMAIILGTGL